MVPRSPRQPWWRRWFGSQAEQIAADFLVRQGHRILARNWRCRSGELDLVTADGEVVVFVEVRSTASADASRPALSVTEAKQQRLTLLATAFLQSQGLLGRPARFDVVCVHWSGEPGEAEVQHFVNAFPAAGSFDAFA